jgi:hypothetical protein
MNDDTLPYGLLIGPGYACADAISLSSVFKRFYEEEVDDVPAMFH